LSLRLYTLHCSNIPRPDLHAEPTLGRLSRLLIHASSVTSNSPCYHISCFSYLDLPRHGQIFPPRPGQYPSFTIGETLYSPRSPVGIRAPINQAAQHACGNHMSKFWLLLLLAPHLPRRSPNPIFRKIWCQQPRGLAAPPFKYLRIRNHHNPTP
jgi:hypothetical protein